MTEYQRILNLIRERSTPALPGMDDVVKIHQEKRARRIANYLEVRARRMKKECDNWCGKLASVEWTMFVYDSPFDADDEMRELNFCSEDCEQLYNDGDFGYIYCGGCNRMICQRNPSNGWHEHFRYGSDGAICLSCYEENILENGIEREDFESGSVPGMFFNVDNPELEKAGYECVSDYRFIGGREDGEKFCQECIDLIDNGFQVVVAYERLAITGSEGTCSLYAKRMEV